MFKDIFKNISPAFIIIPLLLSVIGLVFIYSSSINPDGSNSGQFVKQLIWIILGCAVALFILNIDYFRLVETSNYFYITGIVLLIIVIIFGKNIRGHKSWMGIGGLGIQFSEIMKVAYILFFAKYLANAPIIEKKIQVFFVSVLILAAPVVFILLQPDFGSTLVYLAIFLVMSYLGMADDKFIKYVIFSGIFSLLMLFAVGYYKYYLRNGGTTVEILEILLSFNTFFIISLTMFLYSAFAIIIDFFRPVRIVKTILPYTLCTGITFLVSSIALKIFKPYMWNRILVMISPEFDKSGAGYNIIQSKIAIGSGGFLGKGLFRGTQNILGFLPEKNTDFIFSIIGEELGFIGSSLIVAIFVAYFFIITRTIQNAKDKEGMLVASGILALFFMHLFINLGMTLGITPATGVPLPFISYGGSSYITFICAAALVCNIYSRRFVH